MSKPVYPPKLNLTRDPRALPFEVDMEAFFDFSFWLAEELTDLIDKHQAAEKVAKRTKHRDRILAIQHARRVQPASG